MSLRLPPSWRSRVSAWLGPLLELRVLLALIGVAASVWGFAAIHDEVKEGATLDFDHKVLLLFREPGNPAEPIGPGWLEGSIRDVTGLGGMAIVVFTTLATAGYLFLARKPGAAWFVLAAILGATLLSFGLKDILARPRPELVPHGVAVYTSSFPSGHATGAAATYLTLGALLGRFQPRRLLKAYVMALAVLITVAVGLSRLYLGVHWPTDVLAGWTLGAGWALLCWLVARLLQRQGAIEPELKEPVDG